MSDEVEYTFDVQVDDLPELDDVKETYEEKVGAPPSDQDLENLFNFIREETGLAWEGGLFSGTFKQTFPADLFEQPIQGEPVFADNFVEDDAGQNANLEAREAIIDALEKGLKVIAERQD